MAIPKVKSTKNIVLNNTYWRVLNHKKTYLFILGLTLSVGDLKLILATSIFTGTMFVAYKFKSISWRAYFKFLSEIFTPENRKLIFSISTAGILALSSYLILNIWTEIDNKWLALGIIWQIIFSTIGLSFLSWKIWQKPSTKSTQRILFYNLSELITQLNAECPLKRLATINDIFRLWKSHQLNDNEIEEIIEYFSLLKQIENEPIIINKLNNIVEKMNLREFTPIRFTPINKTIKQKISIEQ